jgi:hypothetical protein
MGTTLTAERIRQDRAEAAEHERLRSELEAAGTPVIDYLPEGAVRLTVLTHDDTDLTAETHTGCPGRGVYCAPGFTTGAEVLDRILNSPRP